jgi:hypothetical protein
LGISELGRGDKESCEKEHDKSCIDELALDKIMSLNTRTVVHNSYLRVGQRVSKGAIRVIKTAQNTEMSPRDHFLVGSVENVASFFGSSS